jgi:hypothetical protein
MESEYELERRARIVRNHETLALLGLSAKSGLIAGIAAGEGQKKRKDHAGEGPMAVRKSARLLSRGEASDTPGESNAEVPVSASVASWEQKVFQVQAHFAFLIAVGPCPEGESVLNVCDGQEFEQGLPSSKIVWDAHHMHQHLTRSPAGRMVATTGGLFSEAVKIRSLRA